MHNFGANVTIQKLFGLNEVLGDYGIEIELESAMHPFPGAPIGWQSHSDGSLHADYSVEYVTKGAINKEKVFSEIQKVKKKIKDVEVLDSVRAGVHVHMNCQQMTAQQMLGVAFTYLALERSLVKYCGPNRVGNQFCLRASDAEFVFTKLYDSINTGNLSYLNDNSIRYSSLNFCSLSKFGTLEFRAMQTYSDLSRIVEWVDMLDHIKKYGMNLPSFDRIASDISFNGPVPWAKEVLGDDNFELIKDPKMEKDIMRDLRNIQPLIYI